MATEANEVPASKINRNAVNAIASTISKGIAGVNATGGLLHSCVTIARQHYKGKPISKLEIEAVLTTLAETQKWKGRSVDMRKSEYRAVLRNYDKLDEAMKIFKSKTERCSWHDGVALARLLTKNAPSKAAQLHAARGKNKSAESKNLSSAAAKKKVAGFAKRVFKMTKLDKAFRDALRELCTEHGIKV